MKFKLSFGYTDEERFLVTSGLDGDRPDGGESNYSVTSYDSEDTFLSLVIIADLTEREMFDTVHAVLMTINQPIFPQRWVEVDLNDVQIQTLQLSVASLDETLPQVRLPWEWSGFEQMARLHDFFMRVPLPLTILMGPEHRFTFINQPYVNLMRRDSAESVLGKSVREALPELKGLPFYKLLDTVYETGNVYIGHEIPAAMRNEISGEYEDAVFDFIYSPIRNEAGVVEGIMVQATDVTQTVLARDMSAHREEKLFRQWTELEAIYQTAPVALSLLDAKDFRFLRSNQRSAEMIGLSVEEVVGQSAIELASGIPGARELIERAARGASQIDMELEGELPAHPGVVRSWKVSAMPVFDAGGAVVAITVAASETTELKRAEKRLIESEKFVAGEVMAESFVRQISEPMEELKALLGVVRVEIQRQEALDALVTAEEKLEIIARVTSEMARRYWVRRRGKESVEVESSAGR